jgi:putative adhesin
MTQRKTRIRLTVAALVAIGLGGCITDRGGDTGGTGAIADRKFIVTGPVRIELTNGSGASRVTAGPAGEVQVHAEFRVKSRLFHDAQRRLNEIVTNPPISQEGNFIRIGGFGEHWNGLIVNYTITVPADTEIHAMAGSGTIEVSGIKGPANFTAGSGSITASNIAGDVQATAGSGNVELSQIQGQVQATAGSGDIQLAEIHRDIRAQAGSGDIKITKPIDSVEASSGSGSITVEQVSADLRLHTASGDVTVEGNPQANTYWEVHTSSGSVTLHVPADANFRLYARTSSGDIDTQIPIVMEGTTGKHELRARIGDGKARVEIETSSGKISLR